MTQHVLRESALGALDAPVSQSQSRALPAVVAAPGPGIDFAIVRDMAAMEALEDAWNELYRRAGRPHQVFQAFNWCWHWCRHYLGDARAGPQLAVVTGRRAGQLVLVLPLATQRRAGLTEMLWLGEPVSQYGDVLAADVAADVATLEAAWRFAIASTKADVANLRKVRADAVVAPLLAHLGSVVTSVEEAPYLDLSGDTGFSAWEIRRKPKAQKNRRRQARRLADMGEVTYASHTATPEAGRLASRAIRLKRATLADKGDISPALSDERFEAFFREAASDCDRPAGLTIATISSAGEPIALKILVTSDQAYFLHVAVFDAGFEKCAPGALLLEHTIGETIRTGRRTLDLLPPRHGYKMDFADGIILVQCHGLALTAAGWLYTQGYLRLRRHLKGAVEALPAPIRRALMKLAG